MCGIAGIAGVGVATDSNKSAMTRMLDAIVHRGPDDHGMYEDPHALIGMRRLSIIDIAGGHQPITNEDRTIWSVCNGEIYNFRALREELESRGHRFRSQSDSEVVVHAYEAYGERFLEHLDGMFGLALWDAPRQRLILARDRMGIKPLYYRCAPGYCAFASEIKSLLELPSVGADVDEVALRDHLTLGYAVAPRTIFKGISKLSPAEALVFQAGNVRRWRYWQPPVQVDRSLSESAWVERVRSDLSQAVRSHLVSDVPLGAFLSGGMDSSAIVGLMSGMGDGPVSTYSIGYAGSRVADYYNELPFARQVAERYGTHHREIPVDPDVTQLLPRLMWHLEEPICDTAIITTFLVSQLASESVKVIMSGVGGDELFGGYSRYLGDHYGEYYRRIPRWIRRGLLLPLSEMLPSGRGNRLMDLSRYAKQFVRHADSEWYDQYRGYIGLSGGDLLGNGSAARDGYDRVADGISCDDPLLRLFALDSETQLSEMLLLLSDKMTMATSIECRVPFLDRQLVETAAQIPAGYKVKGGRLKNLLRQAVADILPPEVIDRRKRGFGAPMGSWLKGELKPMRDALLRRDVVEHRGLFPYERINGMVHRHDSGKEDHTDLLMVLINLELWFRVFVDKTSASDVTTQLHECTKAA